MRVGRWLILLAILGIVAFVGDTYWRHRSTFLKDALAPPKSLELGTEASALSWCDTESEGAKITFKICATDARELKDPPRMELDHLKLWLYHKNDTRYDLIESDKGEFDKGTKSLYSDAPVDITMGVTAEGPQHGRILKIHTSGVHFDKESGRASTDRSAEFQFDQGTGSATGADYDPNTRQLHMHSNAILDWKGKTPEAKPMHIEAAEAYYFERESKVVLLNWSKLSREGLKMDAGESEVLMEHSEIKRVDAKSGRGVEDKDGREVDFAADHLGLDFGEHMVVRHIEGSPNAKLVSTSAAGQTTATGNRMDMEFEIAKGESTLTGTVTTGNSVAESDPAPAPGSSAEKRILRSETIRMKMQPGGKDIASAETDGPATLEFLPLRPDQPKRELKGDRVWIAYGPDNRIQSFRSVNATTRTEKPPTAKQPMPPPSITSSKDILAIFDPKTSELTRVEQKTDFRYEEGDRQAFADSATLDQRTDVMTLDGKARMSDTSGSTNADRIVLNQKTGDFNAEGDVASTRQPDSNGKSSAMLDTSEVLEARAQRMTSSGHGPDQKIHYEGKPGVDGKPGTQARMWQGSNRITADRLDIDRKRHVLEAHGSTVSQFVDKATEDKAKDDKSKDGKPTAKSATSSKPPASVYTVVKAPDLTYSDETRLAIYQGGAEKGNVEMQRPDLKVTSHELRAYLKDSDSGSSLERAVADGAVKVSSIAPAAGGKPARNRASSSEHAEYYADDGKVIIEGGKPELVDRISDKKTTGVRMIWNANDNSLSVFGDMDYQVKSLIRESNKK